MKRPDAESPAAAFCTAAGSPPVAPATVAATPWSPSQSSVATGPGLTELTRIPFGPTSFESDLQKLARADLAAL